MEITGVLYVGANCITLMYLSNISMYCTVYLYISICVYVYLVFVYIIYLKCKYWIAANGVIFHSIIHQSEKWRLWLRSGCMLSGFGASAQYSVFIRCRLTGTTLIWLKDCSPLWFSLSSQVLDQNSRWNWLKNTILFKSHCIMAGNPTPPPKQNQDPDRSAQPCKSTSEKWALLHFHVWLLVP